MPRKVGVPTRTVTPAPRAARTTSPPVRSPAPPGEENDHGQVRPRQVAQHALRQVGNRLVGILHGCLRTGTCYDEHAAGGTATTHLSQSPPDPAAPIPGPAAAAAQLPPERSQSQGRPQAARRAALTLASTGAHWRSRRAGPNLTTQLMGCLDGDLNLGSRLERREGWPYPASARSADVTAASRWRAVPGVTHGGRPPCAAGAKAEAASPVTSDADGPLRPLPLSAPDRHLAATRTSRGITRQTAPGALRAPLIDSEETPHHAGRPHMPGSA
jgi:hypothetical protein